MFVHLVLAAAVVGGSQFSINVRDFGAVGDGVHDDTLAIQKAADSVYPKGRPERGKDKIFMRTRYRKESEYGVVREVLFPSGTYRITGPVMFSHDVVVRGEGRAVVRNDSPDCESFYFDKSFQMRLSGISFVGGRNQVRVFEGNNGGPIHIDGCTFSGATGTSVLLDSLRFDNGVKYGAGPRPECSPYIVSRGADGRVTLKDRDPKTMRTNYSSPLMLIENCRFLDNAHALRANSDGLIVRNCDFKAPRTASGAVVHAHTQAHLDRLRIFVERNPEIEQYAIETDSTVVSVTDCTIASDGDLTAFNSLGRAYRSSIFTQLQIKNVKLDTGSGPVVRFADDRFPSLVAIHGLTAGMRCRKGQKLFAFEVEPTKERFEKWYSNAVKGANIKIPRMDDMASYAVVVEGVDAGHFDVALPPVLERFRRAPVPGIVRQVSERFDGSGDFGEAICAEGIGTGAYSEKGADATDALERLIAEAAKRPAATIVLPPKWIRTTRPLKVSGRVKFLARGVAVVTGDDCGPIFEVERGADVFFENIAFHRGRNAIATGASEARVRLLHCFLYDQKDESILAVCGSGPSRVRVEVTGGNAYSHAFYRGNANPMLFDAAQLNNSSNYTLEDYKAERCTQYCNPYVNLEGGRLEMHDILCTPWFMEHQRPLRSAYHPPMPWQMGDFRYIDNYGDLAVSNFRFGGEWGGLTPVYHYGRKARTYLEGGYAIQTCPRLRSGAATVLADTPEADVAIVELGTSNFLQQKPAYAAWRDGKGRLYMLKSLKEAWTFPFAGHK